MEERKRRSLKELNEDKVYFASFLNLARHYAYLVIKDVSQRFEKYVIKPSKIREKPSEIREDRLKDADILKFLRKEKEAVYKKLEIASALVRAFPFLMVFRENSWDDQVAPEVVGVELMAVLSALSDLRNEYSHYYYKNKVTFSFDLQKIFESARDGLLIRFKDLFSSEKDINHLKEDRYSMLKADKELSMYGKVFLTCLFLDREYAFKFLSGIQGFSTTTKEYKKKFRATLECFTFFCLKVPTPRLQSDSLGLDILNELNRCPSEVYKNIEPENQKKFKLIRYEETDLMENFEANVIMKRYGNRFSYFILRFFDEAEWFENLRFQILFGRVNTAQYEKKVNGISTARQIVDDLTAFVRWNEVSEEGIKDYPNSWKVWQGDKCEQFHPAIEQHFKKYKISGNKIAIKLVSENKGLWSEIKMADSGVCSLRIKKVMPDAILSVYELPNLFVYQKLHLDGKIKDSADKLIKNYIDNFREFVQKVQEAEALEKNVVGGLMKSYGLQPSFLPKSLKEYLCQKETNNAISMHERLMKKIKKQKKETDEKLLKTIQRAGQMATVLARDIVFLMPGKPDMHRGKLNNEEYNDLQALLAFFGRDKDLLKKFFDNLSLLENHPVLKKIKSKWHGIKRIKDFYVEYYKARKEWLQELLKKCGKSQGSYEEAMLYFPISTKSGKDRNYLTVLSAGKRVPAPVVLPRGMFNRCIANAFQSKKGSLQYFLDSYQAFDKETQPFYLYPRVYRMRRVFSQIKSDKPAFINESVGIKEIRTNDSDLKQKLEEIKTEIKTNENKKRKAKKNSDRRKQLEQYVSALKNFKRQFLDTEKQIRLLKVQDRILWCAVKELLSAEKEIAPDFTIDLSSKSLNFVGFDQPSANILRKEVNMCLKFHGRNIEAKLPLRKYGHFRRILKDRRLWVEDKAEEHGLLLYWNEGDHIELEALKTLLDQYEKQRIRFLKSLYDFERKFLTAYPDWMEANENKGHVNFSKQLRYFSKEKGKSLFEPFTEGELIKMRNYFLHNKFPYEKKLAEFVTDKSKLVEQIVDKVVEVYEKLIKELEPAS